MNGTVMNYHSTLAIPVANFSDSAGSVTIGSGTEVAIRFVLSRKGRHTMSITHLSDGRKGVINREDGREGNTERETKGETRES